MLNQNTQEITMLTTRKLNSACGNDVVNKRGWVGGKEPGMDKTNKQMGLYHKCHAKLFNIITYDAS